MSVMNSLFWDECNAACAAIPPACHPWGRGWSAAVASIFEAAAAKPGNVHPTASFPDLSFGDLVAAGIAIAEPMDQAVARPVGETILTAVRASRAATPSNANLGIVLLVAPVAAVLDPQMTAEAIDAILASLSAADAEAIWQAIALARPGGLGTSDRCDIAGPPPGDVRAAMQHAADRDSIAWLWANGYADLFAGPVADLARDAAAGVPLPQAIVRAHIRQLARVPDSLIVRRHGSDTAADVSRRAQALVADEDAPNWPDKVAAFDAFLRQPRRLNPGTTADLLAAAIYILLRDGRLRPILPCAPPSLQSFNRP